MTNTTIKVIDNSNKEQLYTIEGNISDKCLTQELGFKGFVDGKKNIFKLDLGTQVLYTHLNKQNDYLVSHKDNIDKTEKKYGGEYTPSSTLPPHGTLGGDPPGDISGCDCTLGSAGMGINKCVYKRGCTDIGCSKTMWGAKGKCQQVNDGVNNSCYCITPAPCSGCLLKGQTCATACPQGSKNPFCEFPTSINYGKCCHCG